MLTSLFSSVFMFFLKLILIVFYVIIFLPVLLFSLLFPSEQPLSSLGNHRLIAAYTSGGFQDYTDYKKYLYEDACPQNSKFFSAADDASIQVLNLYIDDFEGWVNASGEDSSLALHYDFDRETIDSADYYYIDDGTASPDGSTSENFYSYDVYFFDSQSSILYFFHSNI